MESIILLKHPPVVRPIPPLSGVRLPLSVVVAGRGVEAVKCFEHSSIGPGLGLDGIEEVTCLDKDVGFLFENRI